MPITGTELVVGILILVGVPIAVVWLNKRMHPAGWWLMGAVAVLLVIGNMAEWVIG